jgi:predicted nuclease of predicted toxin-antitoxin system
MNILADENVAKDVVAWLRNFGHDILYASEARPGSPDTDWLTKAELERRILLTSDKDFGDLVFRDSLNSHGIVLLRIGELTVAETLARLQAVWSVIEANPTGSFIVVTQTKIRVRPLTAKP